MSAEMGEFVVAACLRQSETCDIVETNARLPGGGMHGLREIDVIGLRFVDRTAFVCEVATHLDGLNYGGGNSDTIDRVRKKLEHQRLYASRMLGAFDRLRFSFWSPSVPSGLVSALREIDGLELIVNADYTHHVDGLRSIARKSTRDFGNPFMRSLQILEHLKR